jgi:uncharacterized membrane protein YraQ (UPF0718 family)
MDYINYIVIGLVIVFFIQRMIPTKGVRQISISE